MNRCWMGYFEWLKAQPGADPARVDADTFDQIPKTCLLSDGHEGPHEWTDDGKILFRFK